MNNWLIALVVIVVFAVGSVWGYILRDIHKDLDRLFDNLLGQTPAPPPVVGPTQGSYKTVTDVQKPTVRVVTPKSPTQLEWERSNRKPDIMGPEK
jgi:hypothetical protein